MLILILSCDLELKFVSHAEDSPGFRPHTESIGMSIEASKALIEADPDLPLDCWEAASGGATRTRAIGDPEEDGYWRRISVRESDDGCPEELVVSYEAGHLAPSAELAKARRRLVNALEAIPDPVAYFNSRDRLVLCNTAYSELHAGKSSAGTVVSGMRFEEILKQGRENGALEISDEAQAEWLSVRLNKRQDPVFETETRTRDGRWFRVVDRVTEVGDRVHLLIDVTSMKKSQSRLEEVEAGARVGMWSFDMDSGQGTSNGKLAEILGYFPSELANADLTTWQSLAHPDDWVFLDAGFNECMSGERERCELQFRMKHKKGRWVWVMARGGVAERDPNGKVRQMAGVLLDISVRKKLETELKLRAAAVEASADAIMITDASGSIVDANPALLRLFRAQAPQDVLGHPWYRLYARSAAADLAAVAFPVIRSDRHWQGDALAKRLDGSQFEQSISMTELPDGKIVHVSRDVSALKELERGRRILREEIELAQRQEVINLLAAGLTHDFSNLLAVISHLTDPDSAVAFEKIDIRSEIHRASRQMIDLLEPLRGYVKGTAVEKDADLVDVVRNAAELTALGAPLGLSVESDLPVHALKAMVDPLRLTQVLMNLGLNARDVIGHEEGTIRFALSRDSAAPADLPLELGQVPAAPFAHMIVSDTGSGIPNDIRQRIWEPYFTTKGDQGTGLGLALIAAIIRDVGGGIALETGLGHGTTFHLFWPLNHPEAVAEVGKATVS